MKWQLIDWLIDFGQQEIVGNMVGAMPGTWLRPKRDDITTIKRNLAKFRSMWDDFDWTAQLEGTDM